MSTRLYDIGHDILEVIEAALSAVEPDALELPDARYVNNGDIARDQGCSSLVVAVPEIFMGHPGAPNVGAVSAQNMQRSATYIVELTRCVPTPDGDGIVTAEETDASGRELLQYGDVMHDAIRKAILNGTLLERCSKISMGTMTNIGPEGGIGGWRLALGVQL